MITGLIIAVRFEVVPGRFKSLFAFSHLCFTPNIVLQLKCTTEHILTWSPPLNYPPEPPLRNHVVDQKLFEDDKDDPFTQLIRSPTCESHQWVISIWVISSRLLVIQDLLKLRFPPCIFFLLAQPALVQLTKHHAALSDDGQVVMNPHHLCANRARPSHRQWLLDPGEGKKSRIFFLPLFLQISPGATWARPRWQSKYICTLAFFFPPAPIAFLYVVSVIPFHFEPFLPSFPLCPTLTTAHPPGYRAVI